MVREIAITFYLFVFRVLFSLCQLFPQKKKTTCVASFGDNIFYTVNALEKQFDDYEIVILKTSHCKLNFSESGKRTVLIFEIKKIDHWIRSIYHLATSEKVFVDNYYGFLAAAPFKANVQCIQLWHAAGAIKKFGWQDPLIRNRSPRAHKRFQNVYQRFDKVVVGSEHMANIFKASFGLTDKNILRTGIPRTDFLFDHAAMNEVKQSFADTFPVIKEKKVILYAPTYRDHALDMADLALDLDKMYRKLKHSYVLFLRLHPAVNETFENKFPGFVFNVSNYHNVNHLLVIADLLLTDYSSIPFEFALLHKPMVFFAYDLETYADEKGFWYDYEDLVPGPIVKTTQELIDVVRNNAFDMERIKAFAREWNQYSNGNASKQLIEAVFMADKQHTKAR